MGDYGNDGQQQTQGGRATRGKKESGRRKNSSEREALEFLRGRGKDDTKTQASLSMGVGGRASRWWERIREGLGGGGWGRTSRW